MNKLSHLSAEATSFATDLRGWARNRFNRVTGADRRELAERFAAWIEQGTNPDSVPDSDTEELRQWVDELDQQGKEALTEQLTDFCDAFEIELAWLVDGELSEWPKVEATLTKMVFQYCLACKAAVDSDEQLRKFRHRRVWKHRLKNSAPPDTADASQSP